MTASTARGGPGEGLILPERPVLLYDGDCGFCTRSAQLIEAHVPGEARLVPWQFADLAALGTTPDRARREVLWAGRDGKVRGGAQAFAAVLVAAGGAWALAGRLLRIPPIRWLAHLGYRLVSANRRHLPGTTPACALPPAQRPGVMRRKA